MTMSSVGGAAVAQRDDNRHPRRRTTEESEAVLLTRLFLQRALLVAGASAVGGVAVLALLSLLARRPDHLGHTDGRLAPCPNWPNCVCSQEAGPHGIAPFAFEGSPEEALAHLRDLLAGWPRTRVV